MSGFLVLNGNAGLSPGSFAITGAWPTSTHTVHVELNEEPAHVDPFATGDALNPRSWSIVRADTGAAITVIGVTSPDIAILAQLALGPLAPALMIGPPHPPRVLRFDLQLLEPLGHHLVSHTLTTVGMVDPAGNPLDPSFTFPGCVLTMDPVDSVTGDVFRDRDLANPPFQVGRQLGFNGTLVIGPDGDYETDAGLPLIRKLVLRRMGTRRGAFRHLPTYGLGLIEKEPIPGAGDLVAFRKEIEEQAQQEPDVAAARARLSMDRSGVLVVQLELRAQNGMTLNLRMGNRAGQMVEL